MVGFSDADCYNLLKLIRLLTGLIFAFKHPFCRRNDESILKNYGTNGKFRNPIHDDCGQETKWEIPIKGEILFIS